MPIDKLNKRFDENFFQSPVPFLIASKNLMLGKKSPTIIFRICFYITSIISTIYLFWHLISFVSILFRHQIFDENRINVDSIILNQAKILGFDSTDFIKNLELFHCFSMICWGCVFVSAVFLWRRMRGYFIIYLLSFLSYIILMWVLLGMDYIKNETTTSDSILFVVLLTSMLVPYIYDYLKRGRLRRLEEQMQSEED